MTQFFKQFLEPDPIEPEPEDFQLIKEAFALTVDDFVSAHDVLFRKYDFDTHDETAKKYSCDKMPWKILTEGIAKRGIQFPHAAYMKMRRNTKHDTTFFASWNYQIGDISVGTLTVPGSGYALRTYNIVEKDLRKLIQRVVDDYNKSLEGPIGFMYNWNDKLKFEAVPKEEFNPHFHDERVIGIVVSLDDVDVRKIGSPEVMIIETQNDRIKEDKGRHG